MKFLIIAPIFLDTRRVASQRARAIAQVLSERGNEVTVLAAAVPPGDSSPPPEGLRVVVADSYDLGYGKSGGDLPFATRVLVALSVLPTEPLTLLLKLARTDSFPKGMRTWAETKFDALNLARFATGNAVKGLVEGKRWAKNAYATLQSENEQGYDVVFSTFGPSGSIRLAEMVLEGSRGSLWVSDFRDAQVGSRTFPWIRALSRAIQKRAVRNADVVTAVSKGVRKTLLSPRGFERYSAKTFVVTNGYLKHEDALEEVAGHSPSIVKIAYVGQLYPGRSRPEMLFEALREQSENGPNVRFEFHYAGSQSTLVKELAEKAGVEDLVVDHGFVSHERALQLQEEADALLVLAWNEVGDEGVLSAKFFEYMAVEKPMIALVSGSKPGSELAEMVQDMNLGVAAEYVEGSTGTAEVNRFLAGLVEVKEAGDSPYRGDREKVGQFDYRSIVARLESLIGRHLGAESNSER